MNSLFTLFTEKRKGNFITLKGFAILFGLIRIECHLQFSENSRKEKRITHESFNIFFSRRDFKLSYALLIEFIRNNTSGANEHRKKSHVDNWKTVESVARSLLIAFYMFFVASDVQVCLFPMKSNKTYYPSAYRKRGNFSF